MLDVNKLFINSSNRGLNMEVIEGKKKRKRGKVILIIVIIAFLIYAAFSAISQQIQIGQKENELALITQELNEQNIKNNELKNALDAGINESSDYIERVARSNNYAYPGEKIFVNISGN